MKLHDLLAGLSVELPAENPEIRGIAHDSRRVSAGDLFVAIVGGRHDGRIFAVEAVERGAVAVLGPARPPLDLGVPWIETQDPRALLGPIAARVYGHPDRRLDLVGVTGTNGKSTVVALLASIFEAAGTPAGVIGTLGYRFGEKAFEGERTTPEASDLFRILAEMADAGARAAVMEVSSHALEMGRVAGASYRAAVFTNLTRDHLDFHLSMEAYFGAKRKLFDQLSDDGRAVVNAGDPWGKRLIEELPKVSTYGPGADVEWTDVELDLRGVRGTLSTPRGRLPISSRLLGRLNLENVLAAAATAEALGLTHEAITRGIAERGPLRGRMELVAEEPIPIVIDFAHTPGALEAALRSLRELTERKIAVVFGCGGDRDPGKRAPMGRIAGEIADFVVVTSDNPRGEDPQQILNAVEEGVKASGLREYRIVPDRREAIRRTINVSADGWLVLVAGKGHEEMQIIGGRELPFSDHEEVAHALEERSG